MTETTPQAQPTEGKPDARAKKAPKPNETLARAIDMGTADLTALGHVPVEVQVVLGRAKIPIASVLKLGRGAVVEIDRKVGEQVEIHINHRPVAKGEIVIVDDDRLGVTLTEIFSTSSELQ